MLPLFTRIRTKLIVVIILAVLIPLISTALYGNWVTSRIIEEKVKSTTFYDLRYRATHITAALNDIRHQVLTLSQLPSMRALLDARDQGDTLAIAHWTSQLAADFLAMARMHPTFYQLRYIGEDGQEWVRINSDGKTPYAVTLQQLQTKADRYYFTETMRLPSGIVYISPLDLNQEQGYIEFPYVPVIRYGTPIFNNDGGRAGIVIVNIFAQELLDRVVEEVDPTRRLALVDEDGYYLAHPDAGRTWGGPGDLNTGHGLLRDYPKAWEEIHAGKEDILYIRESDGEMKPSGHLVNLALNIGIGAGTVIQYAMVAPVGTNSPRWFILDEQPAASLFEPLWYFRVSAASILALAVLVAIFMAIGLSYSLTSPIMALREGVKRLQRGEKHQPVEVGSRDEIQDLALAFDEMAVALERRLEQLGLLTQAGYHIATQTEKGLVLKAIIQAARTLFNAEYYVVSLKEKQASSFTIAIASGNEAWALHRDRPEVGRMLQQALDDESWHNMTLTSEDGAIGYFSCAPLHIGSQGKGLLELYGRHLELKSVVTGNLLATLAIGASIALEKADLYQQLVDHKAQLEALLQRLVTVQEEERRVVAYEIHDSLVQMLVGIRLHLNNFMALRNSSQSEAELLLKKGLEALIMAIIEARRIVEGLRPTVLDDLGLVEALRQHVESLGKEIGWQVDFQAVPADLRAPMAIETTFFRIAQEALSNARRHASASQIRVDLATQNGNLILEVQDNGKGFDDREVKAKGRGLGLDSMRERAELLGGRCHIQSAPGHGTRVQAVLPLKQGVV